MPKVKYIENCIWFIDMDKVCPNLCGTYVIYNMKTPERWRALPQRALFASIFAQKSFNYVKTSCTWRHDVVPSRHMTSWCDVTWRHFVMTECTNINLSETSEITFFNLATLTFDLWPWPLNLAEIISRSFPLPNFVTLGQTVQPWERWLTDTQTHRLTDRRDRFYTLDRWRGREIRYTACTVYTVATLYCWQWTCSIYCTPLHLYCTSVWVHFSNKNIIT